MSAKTNEFDYYIIGSTYPDDVPLLKVDDSTPESTGSLDFLSRGVIVSDKHIAKTSFGNPIPAKPRLADYFSLDGMRSVFSKKIYDALSAHKIGGLQLVSAEIKGKKNEIHKGFWVANIHQRIFSFDKDETEFDCVDDLTNTWEDIEKIVLDKKLLSKIPLKDRLVYKAKEDPRFSIYHKTVVDIIMSVDPEGVCFTPIEEWES